MGSFEHLTEAGIAPGETLAFDLREVTPAGVSQTETAQPVEGFAGGGFYGSVVVLPDSVIKTAQPGPGHEFLREINWPVPFPSRTDETAAQLDQLSGKVLHKLVPGVTGGSVITPDSLGYTQLDGLGYGQVIERVRGRIPTFRDGGDENKAVRDARRQIWDIGSALGIEHAAQAHPRNPFGKPNLWVNEQGQVVWLDYLPAFRHTGLVKPFFRFPFHFESQRVFASDPPYNRIDTDKVRHALDGPYNDNFTSEELDGLSGDLDVYDELRHEHDERLSGDSRSLFIDDALARGLIEPEDAAKLSESSLMFKLHRARHLGGLAFKALSGTVKDSPLKILWNRDVQRNALLMVTDPEFRRTQILERTTLRGLKQAKEQGLVDESEYEHALGVLPQSDLRLYTAMQTGYFATSRLIDLATVPLAVGAAGSGHPAEAGAAVAAFNIFTPGVIRGLATAAVARLTKKDLKQMAMFTSIPMVGTYFAVPAQIRREYKESGDEMMHYTLRSLAAGVSKVRPYGGWGSDLEEKIWNFGKGELDTPNIDALELPVSEDRVKRYPGKAF